MPSFVTSRLKEKAVLWASSGDYDDEGIVLVSAAVEISCHWQEGSGEVIKADGSTVGYNDALMVDRVITTGSIMRKGKLSDVPATPDDLREVVEYTSVGDVKARKFQRGVKLMKFSDTLPTISP